MDTLTREPQQLTGVAQAEARAPEDGCGGRELLLRLGMADLGLETRPPCSIDLTAESYWEAHVIDELDLASSNE